MDDESPDITICRAWTRRPNSDYLPSCAIVPAIDVVVMCVDTYWANRLRDDESTKPQRGDRLFLDNPSHLASATLSGALIVLYRN